MKDSIKPAKKAGGFTMDGYFLWCPTVIKVGDTYHMFASRWPAEGGIGKWTTHSECVRATSKDLLGPYEFQEVVLQKRPDNWDNSRVHNGKIVKAARWQIRPLPHRHRQRDRLRGRRQVEGPWTRLDKPVMRVSNPAILVKPDNSIYVFGRLGVGEDGERRRSTAASPSPRRPSTASTTLLEDGRNLLENNAELEDPTIWWANDQYNVLLNDWKGKATGTTKAGAVSSRRTARITS